MSSSEGDRTAGTGTGTISDDFNRQTATGGAGGGPPGTTPAGPGEPGPPSRRHRKKGRFAFLKELPALIILAFLLALLIKTFLVQAFYIPSASMEHSLDIGDRVLVNKLAYKFGDPGRGDVIVFENPNPGEEPHRNWISGFFHWIVEGLGVSTPDTEDFIKRVVGLPGETVEGKNGTVYIDGKRLKEPYLALPRDVRPFGPVEVKPGHLFVMGDNRMDSNDSRFQLGQIPIDKVIGRAFIIIWPPSHFGGITDGTELQPA